MVWKVGVAISCRLVLNTARRFAYPFAPVLSRGLNVPLTAVTALIAMNQATAIPGLIFGPLADRLGYRLMMLCGLGMLTFGMFSGGFFPFYWVVMAALFLAGLGKTVFDPAIQAYMSERVPFGRRGLVIGFLEFSWAGSTLVGIPLLGLAIEGWGWRAAFFVLGTLGLLGFGVLRFLISEGKTSGPAPQRPVGLLTAWRRLGRERTALGAIGFAFFMSVANDNLFVVYGAWLEKTFSLSVIALGLGTGAIGAAELLGETMTATFADRFGLKRSVTLGLLLCLVCYGILPLFEKGVSVALAGLFAIFLTFEFTIVSFLSLCTELLPGSRATMMSSFFAAAGVGRIFGALLGGPVWLAGGIVATSCVSVAISTLALASFMWGLKGWGKK
jgi:predicted MFS family arabinose efflux permease